MMLHLMPQQLLVNTGPVDHADWNFRPLLGLIQRARFRLMLSMLGGRRFERMLEVGYGSGVFMPTLSERCGALTGLDVHARDEAVARSLGALGVRPALVSASAEAMPFDDASFDAVVAVSSFEFIRDVERACAEVHRVLAPGGRFFVVTPGHSALVDLGLKVLTGADARRDYGDRRERVIPALRERFEAEATRSWPSSLLCLYRGLRLRRRA